MEATYKMSLERALAMLGPIEAYCDGCQQRDECPHTKEGHICNLAFALMRDATEPKRITNEQAKALVDAFDNLWRRVNCLGGKWETESMIETVLMILGYDPGFDILPSICGPSPACKCRIHPRSAPPTRTVKGESDMYVPGGRPWQERVNELKNISTILGRISDLETSKQPREMVRKQITKSQTDGIRRMFLNFDPEKKFNHEATLASLLQNLGLEEEPD